MVPSKLRARWGQFRLNQPRSSGIRPVGQLPQRALWCRNLRRPYGRTPRRPKFENPGSRCLSPLSTKLNSAIKTQQSNTVFPVCGPTGDTRVGAELGQADGTARQTATKQTATKPHVWPCRGLLREHGCNGAVEKAIVWQEEHMMIAEVGDRKLVRTV
jgi:hypothetical protein